MSFHLHQSASSQQHPSPVYLPLLGVKWQLVSTRLWAPEMNLFVVWGRQTEKRPDVRSERGRGGHKLVFSPHLAQSIQEFSVWSKQPAAYGSKCQSTVAGRRRLMQSRRLQLVAVQLSDQDMTVRVKAELVFRYDTTVAVTWRPAAITVYVVEAMMSLLLQWIRSQATGLRQGPHRELALQAQARKLLKLLCPLLH